MDADNGNAHSEPTEHKIHSRRTSRLAHRPYDHSQAHARHHLRPRHAGVTLESPANTSPAADPAATQPATPDVAPSPVHPSVARATQRVVVNRRANAAGIKTSSRPRMDFTPKTAAPAPSTPRHTPASVLKQQAIAKALHDAPSHHKQAPEHHTPRPPRSRKAQLGRALSVASASLGILVLGGYFTYLYMPNISVRVAAAQTGVDATYPSYRPTGYSLDGPIAYNNSEVKLNFASNAGDQTFAVTQASSRWDSSAVLENYVKPAAGNSYITTRDNGLTIYTYDGKAAWVNNGVFYTIDGSAHLPDEQIRRIATSM